MDIIQYLLSIIQYLYQQNCWLLNFICRYIPLKQWAFDDSHSPKYQKFKIDELPLITDFRQDWTYKDLIPYYEKRYGKKIRPVIRRSECDIPDDCTCPRCNAPKPFLYKNNGSKGQLLCKVCDARFSPDESRFSSVKLRCPHCGNTLVPKKDRKHFIVHKCVNPKCPYYLHNLKKWIKPTALAWTSWLSMAFGFFVDFLALSTVGRYGGVGMEYRIWLGEGKIYLTYIDNRYIM